MQTNEYKFIYFLAALYMSLMTLSTILGNKLIITPLGILAGASLISPFWYIVGDIMTEIYGLKTVMKLFWSVIICQFIFAIACWLVIRLPSPLYWHGQSGYDMICGHLLRIAIFQFVGITIAWNINARLLSKWKVLLCGKHFWLRSVGASGIGLIIFSITSVFPTVYGMYPLHDVISIVTWSCALKIIFTTFLAGPSNLAVIFLKSYEGVDKDSQHINYNPFK